MSDPFGQRLGDVLRTLEQSGKRVVLIGALAAIRWGLVRATTDIDLVVSADDETWNAVRQCLVAHGLTEGQHVQSTPTDSMPDIAFFWTGENPSTRVDVFLGKTEFEQAVIATSTPLVVEGVGVHTASAEAVIVYKLLASRAKDTQDVLMVFDAAAHRRSTLDWPFLTKWARWWEITDRLDPYRHTHGPATGLAD